MQSPKCVLARDGFWGCSLPKVLTAGAHAWLGAGEHCDDDEDLVDEGGGGSDDEEARYGTF